MIEAQQLIEVGRIVKPHGLKGEMTVSYQNPIFLDVKKCPFLVLEEDGIYVPFFIESCIVKTDSSLLLKFEDVETQEAAKAFSNRTLYFDRKCFTPKEAEQYDAMIEEEAGLVGYELEDVHAGHIGTIVDIDDQTENVLFIVDRDGEELLIPAADDLIVEIDDEEQIVLMNLPIGLLNMSEAEEE